MIIKNPKLLLLDWIDYNRLDWNHLSENSGIFKDKNTIIKQKITEFCNEYNLL